MFPKILKRTRNLERGPKIGRNGGLGRVFSLGSGGEDGLLGASTVKRLGCHEKHFFFFCSLHFLPSSCIYLHSGPMLLDPCN